MAKSVRQRAGFIMGSYLKCVTLTLKLTKYYYFLIHYIQGE